MGLPDKIVELHRALDAAGIPHAFGGALALAWCTHRARGTIDVDLNLFVSPDLAEAVVATLPDGVRCTPDDLAAIHADGQVRLWWDTTPVDLFFNTTDFHERTAERARREPFMGTDVPFLACRDLAVFKAFFDRTKDWADLEEMAAAGTLDVEAVLGVLVRYLGGDDHRIARLRELALP
ncbi:MAG: hypothetical protein JJE52_10055 [Acidimicrobiia bacterium]|nr:hypothetical protein [Acidimicrobiia bacterium]